MQRRRRKPSLSLEERLDQEATSLREQAKLLPAGSLREQVLSKADQMEFAVHMKAWLTSPGLRAPI
jgi:hypothetical protein